MWTDFEYILHVLNISSFFLLPPKLSMGENELFRQKNR